MGIAAYNRGTAVIRRQLDEVQASNEMQFLRDLTTVSASHAGARVFCATVVRFGPGLHEVTLMNRRDRGWAEQGIRYLSIWALARQWNLVFVDFGADDCSRYINVIPAPVADGGGAFR